MEAAVKTKYISQKNPKREALKGLSKVAKTLQETEYKDFSINEILLNIMYQPKDRNLVFKSFNSWRECGKKVKRGEKAFLIWGRKRRNIVQETPENGKNNEFSFFPLAFVFSNEQVENIIDEPVKD
jgi:hypothetical protein